MSNILTIPASGSIYFDDSTSGASNIPNLSGNAVALSYDSGAGLNIVSYNATNIDRFSVDGTEGRLFSVSDSLTGDIFSVNDIAGLPLINVYSDVDDVITIGTYSTNALVVKNDKVGVGTNAPTEALDVVGNVTASGSISAAVSAIAPNLIYTDGTAKNITVLTEAAYEALVLAGTVDPLTIYYTT
jgi:hypothetical protein